MYPKGFKFTTTRLVRENNIMINTLKLVILTLIVLNMLVIKITN